MSTPKHQVSVRPQGTNAPSYSPARDIVWLFPGLMRAVGQSLDDGFIEAWLVPFAAQNGLGPVDLMAAYCRMVEAVASFGDWEKRRPEEVLDAAGMFAAHPAARMILFAKLGLATLSVAHHFTRGASASPVDCQIVAAEAAGLDNFAGVLLAAAKERGR